MADYVVSAELELFINDFKKNISAAQNSLENFEKQVKSVSESTKNGFDGKSISNFSSKLENLGSKINKGTSAWGLDLGKFYDKGSSMFQSFGVDVDKFASHFGMSGKLMSAIVACVTALVKLGQEMDEARAEIVKGTGAIGDALDDLELSAKQALVKGVGTSVKETGKLIADLNTRFGYTGKVLEDTAVDFGKFAKAAGVDLNNAVNNVADVMARWNIPLEKSKDLMNQLTKASQVSGASVDELMSAVNTGSVYFEQFGFNLTESIAMLSSFRKNGIQTSTVMTGLRTALSKFSTEGKDAKTAFAEVTKQIKSATNETEAMNIAVSTFGARAGAEMFKAIRSGSASLEEFTGELRGAGYALDDTYDAVRTSKDAMNDLKNALKGTFGGLGQAFSALWKGILDGITEFVRFIEPIVTPIADVFKKVFSKIAEFISWFVKNLREAVQKNKVLWEGFIKVLNDVGKTLKSVFGDFVDIIKHVFGFIFSVIGGKWEEAWLHAQLIFYKFSRIVSKICDFIANIFVDLINFVGKQFNSLWPKFLATATEWYEGTGGVVNITGMDKDVMDTFVKIKKYSKDKDDFVANMQKAAEISGAIFKPLEKVALEEVEGAYGQMDKSLNDLIDEAEARLKVLENAKPGDIGDLSSIGGSDFGYGLGDDDESDEASKRSTAWIEKRLQQQLDAITAEKEARLSAMRDEGATQEELDAKNAEYAQNQILLYEKIQAFKKLADEQALGDIENLEEEKQNLVEYYADENAKYRISVETNTVKAIENIETESTAWKQKLLEQEISMIEYERKSSIELAKKEGQKIAEIKKMEEESIERQFKKYLELLNLKKEVDLESAKSEEEKADIEKYYGNDATSYLLNLYDSAMKETEEKTDSWWNKFKVIMNKVGDVVKKVVSKIVDVVKKGFELAWKVIQITPDDVLNNMLKFADTVQTFFTETLPQMPGLVDSLLNVIEVMVNSITTPETIQLLGNVLATILERTVSWLVDNIGLVLDGLGKLIGALIRGLGSAIATIDWMELFGSIVTGLWNAITEILKALWDGLKEIFSSLGNWFRGIFESIGNWFRGIFESIGNWFRGIFESIGNWFRGIFESIGNWFKEFFQNIGKLFSKDNNSTGSHIAKGILGVLTGGISWIFTGFATGTNNADSGLHLVGEQGPELIDLHGGERIYNAETTRDILSGGSSGSSNVWNVTFNNTVDTTAYTMMRQLKQYQTQLAINGVL